jgi:hypothetical protein
LNKFTLIWHHSFAPNFYKIHPRFGSWGVFTKTGLAFGHTEGNDENFLNVFFDFLKVNVLGKKSVEPSTKVAHDISNIANSSRGLHNFNN